MGAHVEPLACQRPQEATLQDIAGGAWPAMLAAYAAGLVEVHEYQVPADMRGRQRELVAAHGPAGALDLLWSAHRADVKAYTESVLERWS